MYTTLHCRQSEERSGVYFPLQYDSTVSVFDGSTVNLALACHGESVQNVKIAVNLYDTDLDEMHRVMGVRDFLRARDHVVPCICVVNEDDPECSYDFVADSIGKGLTIASLTNIHLHETTWNLATRTVRVPPEIEYEAVKERLRTNIRCNLVTAASVMERNTGFVTMQAEGEFAGTITDVHDVQGGSIFRRGIDAVFTRFPSTHIPVAAVDGVLDYRTPLSLEMGRASLEPLFVGCGFTNAYLAPAFMERSMNRDQLLEDTPNIMHPFFDLRSKGYTCNALLAIKSLTTRKTTLPFANCQPASYIVMRSQRGSLVNAHVRYLIPEYDNGASVVSVI